MANSRFEGEKSGAVSRRDFVVDVGMGLAGAALLPSASAFAQSATTPKSVIKLFNGKDLTGLTTWLKGHGRNVDPGKVYQVQDGLLYITGETFGAILTDREYENYRVVAEWKWGEKTWPPRPNGARDSGLLLHCYGDDGGYRGDWPECIEFQIYEGAVGDFILMGMKNQVSITLEGEMRPDKLFHYVPGKPAETRATVVDGKPTGITYIIPHLNRDQEWKNVKGFVGKGDAEKPFGEWNTIEAVCAGDTMTFSVNGRVVNKATNCTPQRGRLGFQSEGAEIFIRRWELHPLK